MSQTATTSGRGLRGTLIIYVLGPLVLLGIVVGVLWSQKGGGPATKGPGDKAGEESPLALARAALNKQSDLATCRGAVQQFNSHLSANRGKIELPSSKEAREALEKELKLPADEVQEVLSATFTPLDAHHLEACFLLRDAARSLNVAVSAKGKPERLAPLERARVAFDWVVRQVRLEEPAPLEKGQPVDTVPTPPVFVLKRGSGSALERALVFLALLEQFGLGDDQPFEMQGALIYCPDPDRQQRFWACGVAVGGAAPGLYLFDPRLGLPVPGPGGKGIATLAEAAKPGVLAQLTADSLKYDVTAEQAKLAEVFLATPLSALSPRMQLLQDRLLTAREWDGQLMPDPIRVRLAEGSKAARAQLEKLAGRPVRFHTEAVTSLRRFLPKEEGGNDTGIHFEVRKLRGFTTENDLAAGKFPRLRLYEWRAVSWPDFPADFRNPQELPYNIGLGLHLRERFSVPFFRQLRDPNAPRMNMLRGRLGPTSSVPKQLIAESDTWRDARTQFDRATQDETQLANFQKEIREWLNNRALPAYAQVLRESPGIDDATLRARTAAVWSGNAGHSIQLLLGAAISGARDAQTLFQLALFKHEQALRQQVRLDLSRRVGIAQPVDEQKAQSTWEMSVAKLWNEYVNLHPTRPGIVPAYRLYAEALVRAGKIAEARKALRETPPGMTDQENLVHRWLAAQLPSK